MSSVICNCCGEVYESTNTMCPLCGSPNISIIDGSIDTGMTEGCTKEESDCYDTYVADQEDYSVGNAELIIEEPEDEVSMPKVKNKSVKQKAPDKSMVLFAYIGLIFIIFILFFKALFGIVDKSSSKIGGEIFERTTIYDEQDRQ